MSRLRIGTRRSALALWQSRHVAALIQAHEPTLSIELVEMTTQGDRFLATPLAEIGGKGLFVREIEEALLRGEIDLAVHSLKDLPGRLPEGLALADPPIREDPRDALVARAGQTLRQLRLGARVGTSSLRRALQLRALRPDLNICSVRGNVPTRIARALEESTEQAEPDSIGKSDRLEAVVLAAAGLNRLSLKDKITELFDEDRFVPAIGQGILGLEYRSEDRSIGDLLVPLRHPPTAVAATAERSLLRRLGAGCHVPLGAHARVEGDRVRLQLLVGDPQSGEIHRFEREGQAEASEALGVALAEQLLASSAGRLLDDYRAPPESNRE